MLPVFLKKGIMTAMHALRSKSSMVYKLFTSRLKKEVFSIASEETTYLTIKYPGYILTREGI
jgi:hypothetical protein